MADFKIRLYKEKLLKLQNRIFNSSKVMVAVLDIDGCWITNPLTPPEVSVNAGMCGEDNCENIYQEVFRRVKDSKGLELLICSAVNHAVAGFPVFNEGKLAYVWIISHFVYDSCDTDKVMTDFPVLNEESLRLLFDFIAVLTEDIIQLQTFNSRLLELEEKSLELAYKDRLLGLPNEIYLGECLKQNQLYAHLLVLNIVDLRKINDAYGRLCGDKLLMAIRDYLLDLALTDAGGLYRLETADFGVLLQQMETEDLNNLVKKISQRFNLPWILSVGEQQISIFVNIVIGVLPVLEAATGILKNLSSAIEHTLDIGRKGDGIAFFDDDIHDDSRSKLKLELSLRRSVRQNMKGFQVVYQPIVDPGVAVWRGVEALCRWESDEFGPVSPVDFIPLAESSGLISTIGQWVLETAIAQVKAWKLDQIEHFILDVNLSPIQLNNPVIDYVIMSILEKYNYPPNRLCLEITESNELNLTSNIRSTIEDLSNVGIVIALDDFGTGYASLSSLHKLPVKILKTDRSFIKGMENDVFLQQLFSMMVEIAHSSNMKIVAEGVETDAQAQILRKQGADYFQGYKFSRPLPADQLESLLVNFHKPSPELVSMGYTRLDLSHLSDEQGGYDLPPALYKLLNRCMQVLFTHPDSAAGIEFALAHIGEALKVSRSYIFLKEEDKTFSNAYEWCAPGITANRSRFQHLDIERNSPEWLRVLKRDGMLIVSDVNANEYREIGILGIEGVKAVVEFPIWHEEGLLGFVGFHDCEKPHYWSREEIQMLHTLSSIIMSIFGKIKLQAQVALKGRSMEQILNYLDTRIYVTDLDTYEILFANEALKEGYDGESLEGEICYKAIHGFSRPCSFCPVPHLKQNKEENVQREYYNQKLNAYFKVRDAIIPWAEKREAHFGYGLNITELKGYQIKQEVAREMESFAGLLDKENFTKMAVGFLNNAALNEVRAVMAIVHFEISGSILDLNHHQKREDLLLFIKDILRKQIRRSDMFCQYADQGLIMLFYDCDLSVAVKRLNEVFQVFREKGGKNGFFLNFSYGLAEKDEISCGNPIDEVNQLFELAKGRLLKK